MTIEEKLTRCAALIEKIGRGPVWCEGERVRVRLRWKHDKKVAWWIKERYDSGCWRHYELMEGKPHDIACILKDWLWQELVDAGCTITMWKTLTIIRDFDGVITASSACNYTALIEAAEKVLVEAVT